MRLQTEISRHRHVHGSRRSGRDRSNIRDKTKDAVIAAKAMADALEDILRSERS